MQRWPVESSQIAEIGYDAGSRVLEIVFKRNNAVYHYTDVPPEVHAELMEAKSVGKYFNANVRDVFKFHKLEAVHAASEEKASTAAQEGSQAQASTAADPDSGSGS